MNRSWAEVVKVLWLSLAFTIVLLLARVIWTGRLTYLFFGWNLFLAGIPLFISWRLLKLEKPNFKAVFLLALWLLFLPNAPYIITDLFHLKARPPVPKWFDLMLITSAAWNGLILGIVSLLQVEAFLNRHLTKTKVNIFVSCSVLLCAFGVYLGRYLRFNSWDVITDPGGLFYALLDNVLNPLENMRTWGFTLLFGAMLLLFYHTIKRLSGFNRTIHKM